MKNILISGITGFVGKNLSTYLLGKQYRLNNLGRKPSLENGNIGFTWNNLDELRRNSIEVIIHLAGKAHDIKNTSNDQDYFTVNTELTKELFDLFLQTDSKDFIYFSSVKAVADSVKGFLTEDEPASPLTPYGKSKLKAEEYILSKTVPEGKRVFIIRPCMIHGPGNKGNLNLLYKVVQKGIPYPLAAFGNQRSFLSIANLNYVIEKLISDPSVPGGIYNVADDTPLSTNEVIRIIAETLGNKPKLWSVSPSFVRAIAVIGDKLRLPLNTERLKKLTENYVVSNEKIKRALNISMLPVSSREGLLQTILSFRTS